MGNSYTLAFDFIIYFLIFYIFQYIGKYQSILLMFEHIYSTKKFINYSH